MSSLFAKVLPPAIVPTADFANRADVLTADIPSGGTMSAHGIAKMYAALLAEVDGVRLIGPEGLELISGPALVAPDELMGNSATWALGYPIGRLGSTVEETPTVFGMPGMGGSAAWADRGAGVAFALTKNMFDPTTAETAKQLGNLVARSLC